jgi:hypothetical protein
MPYSKKFSYCPKYRMLISKSTQPKKIVEVSKTDTYLYNDLWFMFQHSKILVCMQSFINLFGLVEALELNFHKLYIIYTWIKYTIQLKIN